MKVVDQRARIEKLPDLMTFFENAEASAKRLDGQNKIFRRRFGNFGEALKKSHGVEGLPLRRADDDATGESPGYDFEVDRTKPSFNSVVRPARISSCSESPRSKT